MNLIKTKYNTIYFSEKPFDLKALTDYIAYLTKNRIKYIIVLLTMSEIFNYYKFDLIKFYNEKGFKVYHFPISDYSVPKDFNKFNIFIDTIISLLKKSNIAVHCSGGIGRTGVIITAVLSKLLKKEPYHILSFLRQKFFVVETEDQEDFLDKYYMLYIE